MKKSSELYRVDFPVLSRSDLG